MDPACVWKSPWREKSQELPHVNLAVLQARCAEEILLERHYQQCRKRGIDYGVSFQAMVQLYRHTGEALGQVRLKDTFARETENYNLHPVLLDACFQVAGVLLADDGSENAYLPVGVERLQIYRHSGTCVWSHAQMRPSKGSSQQSLTADLQLFDLNGQVIATVEGLQLKQVNPETLLRATAESLQDWLYEVKWRPQIRQGQQLPPDYLPTPSEVKEHLESRLTRRFTEVDFDSYQNALTRLEMLSIDYILKAFQEMGWEFQLSRLFSSVEIAKQLGIVSQHQRLLNRLLEILTDAGILRQKGDRWEVAVMPEIQDPQAQLKELLAQYPIAEVELALFERCGAELAQVLRGECDPLQLLFPEADLTTSARIYQDSFGARIMNTLIQQAVVFALENLPQRRALRILEIGAGTGGTTSYILPHLPSHQTEYVFTDVSHFFIAQAQKKFSDYPWVRYQLLDIERSLEAQGFSLSQYDIIIAANVLHTTRDLRQTLHHVQQLLASGGMLVLLEGTSPLRWLDLVFGLTEGWWKFADRSLRPAYPLLYAPQWQQLLHKSRFQNAVLITPDQGNKGTPLQQSVIVARAPEGKLEIDASEQKNWLILADARGIGQGLADLLRARGEMCTLVFPGETYKQIGSQEFTVDPTNLSDFQQLLSEVTARLDKPFLHGVVHLWSLGVGKAETLTLNYLDFALKIGCRSVLHIIQTLIRSGFAKPPSLWLVTRGAQPVGENPEVFGIAQSPLWGMGRVVGQEHPELNCRRIDLDPEIQEDEVEVLFEEVWSTEPEDQIAFRNKIRHVARLARQDLPEQGRYEVLYSQPFKLGVSDRGTLENLEFQPTNRRQPNADEIEIQVRATGLNFLDVLNALGGVTFKQDWFGGECSGEVVTIGEEVEGFEVGDKVIAMAFGSFSQYVIANAAIVAPKPELLSFEEAATIPVAFLTAYYSLHHVARMSAGERVLIHAAAGGVGQAAVQLARQAGVEIFATASPGKWEFLKSQGIKHIMNSRTLNFADDVMRITRGQGVDIVLNSLTGKGFISKSLSVLRTNGRFLEIGKRGVWESDQVAQFRPDVSYFLIDLLQITQQQPTLVRSILYQLMEHFRDGILKPLPKKVFPIRNVVNAFRYMQQVKHIGKIVVSQPEITGESEEKRSIIFQENKTYLITGGLGGLGLLVAHWMVERGARHLVLVGRHGATTDAVREQLKKLEQAGAQVVMPQADVSKLEQVSRILTEIDHSLPPLRGIIHAAGVLDDGMLLQQNWERFDRVLAPKLKGAWILHELTRNRDLDFFVLFSSATALLGTPGQANHAAANVFLDTLAYLRQSQGLPGLSINWGAWSDIGAAARRQIDKQISKKGVGTIPPALGLQVLEQLLEHPSVQVGVVPIKWPLFMKQFAGLSFLADFKQTSEKLGKQRHAFLQQLEKTPVNERRACLIDHIRYQVAKVTGLNQSELLDIQRGFFSMGMDSLTSMELKNRLKSSLGCELPSTLAFDYPTIETLVDYLSKEVILLEFESDSGVKFQEENDEMVTRGTALEKLSQNEIADLLAQELRDIKQNKENK